MDDSQESRPIHRSDARGFSGRTHTSTVDYSYYPHEMRAMKRRQKCMESLVAIILLVPYCVIILASVGSFCLLYIAQTPLPEPRTCILGDGRAMCIVIYVFHSCVAVGGLWLTLMTIVKACLVWYAPLLLVIDFSLLFLSLFIAMAMSVTITIANIFPPNMIKCDNSDTGSGGCEASMWFRDAMIVSWCVTGAVFITILMEAVLTAMVRKCRQRLDYQRL